MKNYTEEKEEGIKRGVIQCIERFV